MVDYSSELRHPSIDRLSVLRSNMSDENIDWMVIYSADAHMSEYVGAADKAREYFSGFTGSAGTMLVGREEAYLWTDSRYFVQAEKELSGSEITLMRDGMEGVDNLTEYLSKCVWEGQVIATDFRTISISSLQKLKEIVPENVEIIDASRIIGKSWNGRPKREFHEINIIDETVAGCTTKEKIDYLRNKINEIYIDELDSYSFIVSDLCSIMWLLNIRGKDIAYVPVAYSYLVIDANCIYFYCNRKAVGKDVINILNEKDIIVKEYGNFYNELDDIATDIVLIDPKKSNALIVEKISGPVKIWECDDILLIPKHIKNYKEIEGMKNAHLLDGVVMTKFIYKLKHMDDIEKYTEYDLGLMLDNMRLLNEQCQGLSFETICAYGENAAIVHYSANEECTTNVKRKGMILIDSGAHYECGTTDVTRTISLGEVSDEEKKCYTAVLKGNLALADMIFPKGVKGDNLDVIARKPIWDIGYDFGHGTGHGIGCRLSVHEDPVRISYRGNSVEMVPGIVVSDEPGIYVEGEFGIRIENALLCEKKDTFENKEMLGFDSLTLVPFDRDAIDVNFLEPEDIKRLNNYHKRVFMELSKYLDEDECQWLACECQEIDVEA